MKMKYDTSTLEGKIAVMQEYQRTIKTPLCTYAYMADWKTPITLNWDWEKYEYNYPAEPTLKPWTFETCPKVGLLFEFENVPKNYYVPTCFTPAGVAFSFQNHVEPYEALLKGAKYSLDAGKTWQPCGNYEN